MQKCNIVNKGLLRIRDPLIPDSDPLIPHYDPSIPQSDPLLPSSTDLSTGRPLTSAAWGKVPTPTLVKVTRCFPSAREPTFHKHSRHKMTR